jgi:hypothetical protein
VVKALFDTNILVDYLNSSIQSRANLPDWMSPSTRLISFLVSGDAGCAAGTRIERIDHENTIAPLIMSQLLVVLEPTPRCARANSSLCSSQLLVVLGMVGSDAFDRDRPGTFRPR